MKANREKKKMLHILNGMQYIKRCFVMIPYQHHFELEASIMGHLRAHNKEVNQTN